MPDGTANWFGRYLPGRLVLGDPGARDAAIHAVQACVPQIALLPVGVERVTGNLNGQAGELFVHAQERERLADGFIYDVELTDGEGRVRERWERLHLRTVTGTDFKGPWPKGLLTPYVERRLLELVPGAGVSIAFERDAASDRRDRSRRAIERALGACGIIKRTNGKPEACDGRDVSASHCGDLTMAVAGRAPVGCDLELVATRSPQIWSDMLGVERFRLAEVISREAEESLDVAATRVWTSSECLKKAGAGTAAPLVFAGVAPDGWVVLASGELKIASCVVQTDGEKEDLAIALLKGAEMRAYEYRHVVGFEETNLVGNVYYANHVRWQGRCREMFLRDRAPEIIEALKHGLAMVTTRVSCEFMAELVAFDEVILRMRLGELGQNRITMNFEYWRRTAAGEELVARGEQQVACMQREGAGAVPVPVPRQLREALREYATG